MARLYCAAFLSTVLFGPPTFSLFWGGRLHWQRCVEGESLAGVFRFICLGFIGVRVSLGDWRKAVSHMAAPRGPAGDRLRHFSAGVVPCPSGEAWGNEPHVVVLRNTAF